jgi:hypothetical protein
MRLFTLMCLACCSGCLLVHPTGNGASGNGVIFQFDNNGGDLPSHPLAAGGARTVIDVSGVSFDDVRSSNPTVATFTANAGQIDVVSGVAGMTDLELLSGGKPVGSAQVFVVDTTQLAVSSGWVGDMPTIVAGTTQSLHVSTVGADGNTTRGDGAVAFTLDGDLITAAVPVDGDAIGFVGTLPEGVDAGVGHVTGSCPNATVTQTIAIVPPAAVTSLAVTQQIQPDGTAIVGVVPMTSSGAVYAEPCAWTTSDSSVTLASQLSGLNLGPGSLSIFNFTRPGTFTVTCSMSGQTATATIVRAH